MRRKPGQQYGMPTLLKNRTAEDNVSLCSSLGLKFIELNTVHWPKRVIDGKNHGLQEWKSYETIVFGTASGTFCE